MGYRSLLHTFYRFNLSKQCFLLCIRCIIICYMTCCSIFHTYVTWHNQDHATLPLLISIIIQRLFATLVYWLFDVASGFYLVSCLFILWSSEYPLRHQGGCEMINPLSSDALVVFTVVLNASNAPWNSPWGIEWFEVWVGKWIKCIRDKISLGGCSSSKLLPKGPNYKGYQHQNHHS